MDFSGFADVGGHMVVLTSLLSSGCRSDEGDFLFFPPHFSFYMQPVVVENITLDVVID